ncbi:MAG TPA: aminotransferase class IV [Acidimicrobiales bacterium]|nr:aminotransferase class IV [Acidimicrobiales bacterium]
MKVWLDGSLVDEDRAVVSVFDHGLTVGDAVFETIAVREGRPITVTRHLQRLQRSARLLGLDTPALDELGAAVAEAVAANSLTEAVVRVLVTSGPGPLGSVRGGRRVTTAVLAGPYPGWADAADVVVVPWPRNERSALAGVKTTSYAENVVALAEARSRRGSEAIFANTVGNLCEGSGSNVFLVLDGVLVTPPLSAGCLAGVSRAVVIELLGMAVEERDVPVSALAGAEEAFLTSATRYVQPIRSVDGAVLPACPGPVTEQVAVAYSTLLERDPDPP